MTDRAQSLPIARRVDGRGGLPAVELRLPNGARGEVYLHGAHVTSYVPAAGARDLLYLSPRSQFREGVAIRGGIPIIFPQFSDFGPLPKHGFARTELWELVTADRDTTGASATLWLRDSAETRAVWPHRFLAELRVSLTELGLGTTLEVRSDGDQPLSFTAAMHTYLSVEDVRQVEVSGLRMARYLDQPAGRVERVDESPTVRFDGEVDRVYLDVQAPSIRISDRAGMRVCSISTDNFPDAVVWNPGPAKAATMADLGADEYPRFVCVEPACVERPVRLEPGGSWSGSQILNGTG